MQYQTGEARLRRRRSKEAIDLAMRGQWEEAALANRSIIDIFPKDIDAHNRLGKALTELGQYAEAREAYSQALRIDPRNAIARKNLRRLLLLKEAELSPGEDHSKAAPHVFIQEMGRAGVASLRQLAPREVLARLAAGDRVYLRPKGQSLIVENKNSDYLGQVEPRIGARISKLMEGGNRYTAAITSLGDSEVKVIIKEIFQHPSQAGRPSFPVKGRGDFRPDVRDSILRYEIEEEEAFDESGYPVDWEEEAETLPEGISIIAENATEDEDALEEE